MPPFLFAMMQAVFAMVRSVEEITKHYFLSTGNSASLLQGLNDFRVLQ